MGLRGQNSWAEAGGRRRREAELCSSWVMGTITSIEKPLSSLWAKPRIWRFLLAGKGSRWKSPRSAFVPRLAGDQHAGLPSLGQAPSLPHPPACLGKTPGPTTLRPSSRPSAVAPGLPWAGQLLLPLVSSPSSPSSPGAQRKSLVSWLPPSVCVCATRDKDQCTEEGRGAAGAHQVHKAAGRVSRKMENECLFPELPLQTSENQKWRRKHLLCRKQMVATASCPSLNSLGQMNGVPKSNTHRTSIVYCSLIIFTCFRTGPPSIRVLQDQHWKETPLGAVLA